jgi:hypothetical protein
MKMPEASFFEWLPWVHIAIGNLKAFLLGTFHGVSGKYLQEYLSEFCYRFNRRQTEKEIPNTPLNLAIIHTPVHSHRAKYIGMLLFCSIYQTFSHCNSIK